MLLVVGAVPVGANPKIDELSSLHVATLLKKRDKPVSVYESPLESKKMKWNLERQYRYDTTSSNLQREPVLGGHNSGLRNREEKAGENREGDWRHAGYGLPSQSWSFSILL